MMNPSTCSRLLSSLGTATEAALAVCRTADQLSVATASSSGRSHLLWSPARRVHGSALASQPATEPAATGKDVDEPEPAERKHRFMSMLEPRKKPAKQRHPIFFPEITLEMMKLGDEQLKEIRETGWTREVAFKTAPHVTKLEIKGFLEAVYGMKVERVQTINYLGKLREVPSQVPGSKKHGALARPKLYREDDWKKAYVTFAPPEGMALPQPPLPLPPLEMLQVLRDVRLRRTYPDPAQGAISAKMVRPAQVIQEIEEEAREAVAKSAAPELAQTTSQAAAATPALGAPEGAADAAKLGLPGPTAQAADAAQPASQAAPVATAHQAAGAEKKA